MLGRRLRSLNTAARQPAPSGGGGSSATWEPTWDDNTFTEITGGNLVATFPAGSTGNIRSSANGTGKKVASFTCTAVGTAFAVGLCNTTFAQYDSGATNTLRYFFNNYVDLMGASQGAGWSTYTTGDRIDVAFDRTANRAWLGKNGTWVGNPVAGTGGIDISGLTGNLYFWAQGNGTAIVTADFNHVALGALSGFGEL